MSHTNQIAAAAVFFAIVAAAAGVWLVQRYRRVSMSPFQFLLFALANFIVRVQWGAKLPPSLPVKRGEGLVIICNHRSSVDPFFFQVCVPWPMHWMVAKEYCDSAAFGWFLRACEVIPTNRAGIDTAATKSAIRYASAGELVGMLPEGRINQTDSLLLPARPGAIVVALKSRVPILPCYLEGAPYDGTAWSPFLRFARVRLEVGERIDLTEYYGRESEEGLVRDLTLRCLREIAKLAGHPEFTPTLAGRRWKPGMETTLE